MICFETVVHHPQSRHLWLNIFYYGGSIYELLRLKYVFPINASIEICILKVTYGRQNEKYVYKDKSSVSIRKIIGYNYIKENIK